MLARVSRVRNIRLGWIKPMQGRALTLSHDMNGTSRSTEGLDARRRRLLYRAWHRGMRETDLITGPFADEMILHMTDDELADFERMLEVPDRELLAWVMGEQAVPANHDTPLLRRLRDFSRRGPHRFSPPLAGGGES
jgi:antitoxin CptB